MYQYTKLVLLCIVTYINFVRGVESSEGKLFMMIIIAKQNSASVLTCLRKVGNELINKVLQSSIFFIKGMDVGICAYINKRTCHFYARLEVVSAMYCNQITLQNSSKILILSTHQRFSIHSIHLFSFLKPSHSYPPKSP